MSELKETSVFMTRLPCRYCKNSRSTDAAGKVRRTCDVCHIVKRTFDKDYHKRLLKIIRWFLNLDWFGRSKGIADNGLLVMKLSRIREFGDGNRMFEAASKVFREYVAKEQESIKKIDALIEKSMVIQHIISISWDISVDLCTPNDLYKAIRHKFLKLSCFPLDNI